MQHSFTLENFLFSSILCCVKMQSPPIDTGVKKTSWTRDILNVFCAFNFYPVSKGSPQFIIFFANKTVQVFSMDFLLFNIAFIQNSCYQTQFRVKIYCLPIPRSNKYPYDGDLVLFKIPVLINI